MHLPVLLTSGHAYCARFTIVLSVIAIFSAGNVICGHQRVTQGCEQITRSAGEQLLGEAWCSWRLACRYALGAAAKQASRCLPTSVRGPDRPCVRKNSLQTDPQHRSCFIIAKYRIHSAKIIMDQLLMINDARPGKSKSQRLKLSGLSPFDTS